MRSFDCVRVAVSALLLLAGARPSLADTVDAQRARGRALAESLKEVDPRLLGEYHFSQLQGSKYLGSERWSVSQGTSEAGPTYRVRVEVSFDGMGIQASSTREATFTPSLALVEQRTLKQASVLNEPVTVDTSTRRVGDTWVATRADGATARLPVRGDVLPVGTSWLLLCRKLDLRQATTYRFSYLYMDFEDEAECSQEDVVVQVSAPAPFEFRGTTLQAHRVRIDASLQRTVVVDTAGRVLAMWLGFDEPPERGLQLAATEEQQLADARGAAPHPDAEAVKATVLTHVRVLTGEEPFATMHEVMDWEAAKTSLAAKNPKLQGKTGAEVAALVEEQVRQRPMPKGLVSMMAPMLEVVIDGDRARVSLSGDSRAFELVRSATGWKIVAVP